MDGEIRMIPEWIVVERKNVMQNLNEIEQLVIEEWPDCRSAAAAARQLCRSLDCAGYAPTLKRLLESLLEDANRSAFDRARILDAFSAIDKESAAKARRESFDRINVDG